MDENLDFSQLVSNSEKRDLEDFELLEQLAKEDVSFLSSLSTVEQVLEDNRNLRSNISQIEEMQDVNFMNGKENKEELGALNNIFTRIETNSLDDKFKDSFAFYDKQVNYFLC